MENTSPILMNLSKAFNSINHELFIANLSGCGFAKDVLKLIHNYMFYHRQRTKVNKPSSFWSVLKMGVPQGPVLRPILSNIH